MRRDQILHLAMEQYQIFREHFSWSLVSDEAEYIHQFRVAVKKLNAIQLLLMNGMDEQRGDRVEGRLWDFIQPVYKTGGKVRNLQVILDLLATFSAEPPGDFKLYLYDRLQEKRLDHDNKAALVELLTEKQFFNELKGFIEQFYNGEASEIDWLIRLQGERARDLIRNNAAGERWHEARRYFKQSAHLTQLAASVDEQSVAADGFSAYREMEQLLGKWHDFFMLNKLVGKYELQTGQKKDANWTAFIKEKTETTRRIEADVCLLADAFQISKT